jgi:type VI secretion system lysozyme-like protein
MLRLSEKLNLLTVKNESTQQLESLNIATSVRHYLQKILNTRLGSVLSAPNMGMPKIDLSEGIVEQEDQQNVLNMIKIVLEKYDPRIESLHTELKENNNITVILSFQLLVTTRSKHVVTLFGKLQSDSTFELELQ